MLCGSFVIGPRCLECEDNLVGISWWCDILPWITPSSHVVALDTYTMPASHLQMLLEVCDLETNH